MEPREASTALGHTPPSGSSQREKTLYGTRIPVQAVNMALENLFGQLANWIKKGPRK